MINQIIEFIKIEAVLVPLEVFSFVGSIIEEIIAPIPSPLVMTIAGTIAHAQNKPLIYLVWIAFFASISKTLTAYLYYFIADKAEDFLLTKFGSYLGISHKQIETIGKNFNGSWSDDLIIFLSRAIPIIPTSLVSLACGFIKVNKKTFLWSTFFGFIVRSSIFLYLGYTGMSTYQDISVEGGSMFSIKNIIIGSVFLLILGTAYIFRDKANIEDILKKFKK